MRSIKRFMKNAFNYSIVGIFLTSSGVVISEQVINEVVFYNKTQKIGYGTWHAIPVTIMKGKVLNVGFRISPDQSGNRGIRAYLLDEENFKKFRKSVLGGYTALAEPSGYFNKKGLIIFKEKKYKKVYMVFLNVPPGSHSKSVMITMSTSDN